VVLAAAGVVFTGTAGAKPWWLKGVESNDTDFLPPDAAFRVGARVEGRVLHIRWVIADGYYLYRQRMAIEAQSPDLELSAPLFPRGAVKTDPYLGTQEIFEQQVEATAVLER
jgi:thiol:disulfide interchange protein DsbD